MTSWKGGMTSSLFFARNALSVVLNFLLGRNVVTASFYARLTVTVRLNWHFIVTLRPMEGKGTVESVSSKDYGS